MAHPAFPNIIKQLSHDEAVILFLLKRKNYHIKQQSDWDCTEKGFFNQHSIEDDFPYDKLNSQSIFLYT
ncbi:Abi-alpha family protein [Chitinophaga sp. 212800010-3]|uniref:Abi-alpha family protein n=1 Tax=unclassified Chitinophaga TaxID=2619133 RepID=UPI003FA4BFCD